MTAYLDYLMHESILTYIQTNPNEITTFLSQETIDNRISLKIVLDKWLI
jgi:hypothetical protein